MAQQDLLGSDKLNTAYQKINANFDELYAGGGGGGGGASDLSELGDVALTLPIQNNQALIYDDVADKWENQDIPRALGALSDVDLVSGGALTEFQVLQYTGTEWVNSKVAVNELSDVEITTPIADDSLLMFETSLGKWINLENPFPYKLTIQQNELRQYVFSQMGVF